MATLQARIPPPFYGVATAVLMWWLDGHLPLWRWERGSWATAGWGIAALGLTVDAICVVGFFRAHTTVNPMRVEATRKLVVTGFYRWSRNPMYGGLMLALIGWGVVLGSLAPLVSILVFQRCIVILQIKPEELALEAKFGRIYREYTQTVNRWIGRRLPR